MSSKPKDYNTKDSDPHFKKINELLAGGKYEHSMDKHINRAHASLAKEQAKEKQGKQWAYSMTMMTRQQL